MNIIFLGPPGAGKGTQAHRVAEHFHIPVIATGDMLRAAITEGSELGKQVAGLLKAGILVPDDLVTKLVLERIGRLDCRDGFLLDGFPRTISQAQALEDDEVVIDVVIEIVVSDELLVERLSGRRIDPISGRSYHILYNPPKVSGKDDITGNPLIQREDDKEETIRHRLSVYRKQTLPLVAYYQKKIPAVRYIQINGNQLVDLVYESIVLALAASEK